MIELLFLVIGFLLAYVIFRKPIEFTVHYTYEDINQPQIPIDMNELEEQMFKEDPKSDSLYDNIDKTLAEVNEIMGGSDR